MKQLKSQWEIAEHKAQVESVRRLIRRGASPVAAGRALGMSEDAAVKLAQRERAKACLS